MNRHESRAYEKGKSARRDGKVLYIGRPYRTLPPKARARHTAFKKGWKAMDAALKALLGPKVTKSATQVSS